MRLLDTLTHEPRPIIGDDGAVRMYVCGVTPYDTTHLGHARTVLAYDMVVRRLRHRGVPVRYVRNVTDVDDAILGKAREVGEHYLDLAERWMKVFDNDMRALNMVEPDVVPRATQEIPDMLRLIEQILRRDQGYLSGGQVYFRVRSEPRYGSLSGFNRARMLEKNREYAEDPDDPRKEDPLDFPLWKLSLPDEPSWPSPWGAGRPGWHIECSAMSDHHLGSSFELHGGGQDLIFPHHENELVQSAGASGIYPFARTWVHAGVVNMDGTKMSKSLGNMAFARELIPRYDADTLRVYLLQSHYRAALDYEERDLPTAQARVERYTQAANAAPGSRHLDDPRASAARSAVTSALDDDLDTPRALAALDDLASAILSDQARDDVSHTLVEAHRELTSLFGLTQA